MERIFFDDEIACRSLTNIIHKAAPNSRPEQNAIAILRNHPFFKIWGRHKVCAQRNNYHGVHHSPLSKYYSIESYDRFQKIFENGLNELLDCSPEFIQQKLKILARVKEISNLNLYAVRNILGEKWMTVFMENRQDALSSMYPRQITIVLTYYCNLSCSFCFSSLLAESEPGYMDWNTIDRILSWMNGKGFQRVCLFGGEPTVHPDFIKIVNRFNQEGYQVYFATNGLYPRKIAEQLINKQMLKVSINIPSTNFYTKKQLVTLKNNLKHLSSSVRMSFRLTLSTHHRDLTLLKELTEKFNPDELSIALAFPDKESHNKFVTVKDIPSFSSEILEFIEIGKNKGIKPVIAKPIPLCAFTESDIVEFLVKYGQISACDIYLDDYLQLTTVNHYGSFYPCIALERYRTCSLDDNPELEDIVEYHQALIHQFLKAPVFEKCLECNLYHAHICQGFCFSYFQKNS